jgi:hypothetical protein
MEVIQLNPMRLTRSAYFRLMVKIWLHKMAWIYAFFMVVGLFALFAWHGAELYGFILLSLPLTRLAVLLWWVLHKDNRSVYEERSFAINGEKIIGTTPSGSRGEIPWSHVVRVLEIDDRYLLYISAGQMIILDKSAFPDRAAEEHFLSWVKPLIKR